MRRLILISVAFLFALSTPSLAAKTPAAHGSHGGAAVSSAKTGSVHHSKKHHAKAKHEKKHHANAKAHKHHKNHTQPTGSVRSHK